MKLNKLAVLACSMILPLGANAAQDLVDLYDTFEEKGNSTLSMDEYKKLVPITGIALEVSKGITGSLILAAGDEEGYELARLTSADDAQDAAMSRLQPGQRFTAECVLQFSSGAHYMSFQQCTFQ